MFSSVVVAVLMVLWTGAQADETTHEHKDAKAVHEGVGTPGHSHERAMLHQGQVSMTKLHHFETVFGPDGIRIFVYDQNQVPMKVGKAMGTATTKTKDGTSRELKLERAEPKKGEPTAYFCPSHPDETRMEPGLCAQCGTMQLMTQDYLFAAVDLTEMEPGSTKVIVHLKGLEGDEPEANFTETVAMTPKDEHHDEENHSEGHSH